MHRNLLLAAMLLTAGDVVPFPPGPETMPTPPKRPPPKPRDADVPDDLVWRLTPPPTPEGAARLAAAAAKRERKAAKRRGDK